ncbi:MAG: 16S rRNA (adenine(1518)-N(6)/adenine(1519)-N(6))-dimethyltransferase RsmA [Polyangiaceae bacterium]
MNSTHPKQLLQANQLVAKHHFGQNFLSDRGLCDRIAEAAVPGGTATTIEIGAGLGALTVSLLERSTRVVAIERDRELLPLLRDVFPDAIGTGQLELREADAKTFDYEATYRDAPKPAVLCGNLPYQLTGPLLRRTLELASLITRATFLVQLEVADRLVAAPASEEYGALTVFLKAKYAIRRAFVVRRGAFYPQPNVDSAVVVLEPLVTPLTEETQLFRELVKCAFAQRRKKLRNAWSGVSRARAGALDEAAAEVGIDLDLRGEVLSVEQYAAMAKRLEEKCAEGI